MTNLVRGLLLSLALLLLAPPALADPSADARPKIRALLVEGRGDEARFALADRLAEDVSLSERAALLELFAIGTAWGWSAPPRAEEVTPAALGIDDGKAPSETEWRAALDVVRAEVARGAFRVASARLELLVLHAPDPLDSARAAELRELTEGALHGPPAPEPAKGEPTRSEPQRVAPRVAPPTRWYGWETMLTDAASAAIGPFAPAAFAVGYLTGAPTVHLLNGQLGKAGASLGLRVGLPLAGALGGVVLASAASSGSYDRESNMETLAAVGAGFGVLGAVIADAAILSKAPVTTVDRPVLGALRPTLSPRREGGVDVGVFALW